MDKYENMSFGQFLETKRDEKDLSLRAMAKLLDVTPQYYSDVEKGRRSALAPDKLDMLKNIFGLTDEENDFMYDLVGKTKNTISPDLPDYIMERDYVRSALRLARDIDAGENDWKVLLDELKKRRD
jgi:transcriptional regulator with XRE-family HTH domain